MNKAVLMTEDSFKEVGDRCGTDKTLQHGYHRFYPAHISHLHQLERLAILEIGYGSGNSIPFWLSIFPGAQIYCLDRDHEASGPGYQVMKCDQSSPEALQHSLDQINQPIHLAIDDGSHKPAHQTLSFSTIFPTLCEDGIYIVEDIETSYWVTGFTYGYEARYGLFNHWSAMEAFKLIADYTNRSFLAPCDRSLLEYRMALVGIAPEAAATVASITFAHNCIIIRKAKKADIHYANAPYIHQHNTHRDP